MDMTLFLCLTGTFFIVFSIAEAIHGEKSPLQKVFSGMLSGAAALLFIHISSPYTGINLPISMLSLTTALIGGIPGTAAMLIINAIYLV